jgi:hypothetical protein
VIGMLRLPASLGLSVGLAAMLLFPQAAARDLRDVHDEAVTLLKRAATLPAGSAELKPLLNDAADRFDPLAIAAAAARLPETLRAELREAAKTLRTRARDESTSAPAFVADTFLALLDRAGAALALKPREDLAFQGSYSQTKVAEPVYGGHATAMGPPPEAPRAAGSAASTRVSPVQFEETACLPAKSFCGSRAKTHILESGGSGVALFDYDGDGWLDVYVLSAFELSDQREKIPHRNVLFRNKGGWKFEDVSAGSGLDVAAWSNGVCAGDYDDDGRLDLYVTTFGPNFLFHNNGDGTFTDRAAAGVQAPGWSTGCTFFDADGDGDLDLYVVRYVSTTWSELLARTQRTLIWRGGPKTMVGPTGLPGEADLFFENRGDGTFKETTDAHGLTDAARAYGFGIVATDYDDDGWVDLYVANDTNPNFLYHNRGDGRFDSVGLASGAALNAEGRAQAGMGVDSGDYDGDGRLDLVVTNFAQDTNTLYRNRDGRQFEDVTTATGLAAPTFVRMGWGTAFFDADLDGALDLFFANGHIYPNVDAYPALNEQFRQKSQLFLNTGAGTGTGSGAGSSAGSGAGGSAGSGSGAGAVAGAAALIEPPHPLPPLPRERGKNNEPGRQAADLRGGQATGPQQREVDARRVGAGSPAIGVGAGAGSTALIEPPHPLPPLPRERGKSTEPAPAIDLREAPRGVRFVDVSDTAGSGLQVARSSRGLAVGDLDNDGDLDLVVSNMDNAPTLLNNRQRTGHHWVAVQVEVEAPGRNRFAIGARVTIDAGGVRQVREIRSGGSYLSQSDLRVYYGLGTYSGPVDVDVRMPGGRTWRWRGQPIDRQLTLRLDDAHGVAAAAAPR